MRLAIVFGLASGVFGEGSVVVARFDAQFRSNPELMLRSVPEHLTFRIGDVRFAAFSDRWVANDYTIYAFDGSRYWTALVLDPDREGSYFGDLIAATRLGQFVVLTCEEGIVTVPEGVLLNGRRGTDAIGYNPYPPEGYSFRPRQRVLDGALYLVFAQRIYRVDLQAGVVYVPAYSGGYILADSDPWSPILELDEDGGYWALELRRTDVRRVRSQVVESIKRSTVSPLRRGQYLQASKDGRTFVLSRSYDRYYVVMERLDVGFRVVAEGTWRRLTEESGTINIVTEGGDHLILDALGAHKFEGSGDSYFVEDQGSYFVVDRDRISFYQTMDSAPLTVDFAEGALDMRYIFRYGGNLYVAAGKDVIEIRRTATTRVLYTWTREEGFWIGMQNDVIRVYAESDFPEK